MDELNYKKSYSKQGEHEFFAMIPYYILEKCKFDEIALYLRMVMRTGGRNDGIFYESRKTMKNKLGMGLARLDKVIKLLLSKGFIEERGKILVETTKGFQQVMSYAVKDIWEINTRYFRNGVPKSAPLARKVIPEQLRRGADSGHKQEPNKKDTSPRTPEDEELMRRNFNLGRVALGRSEIPISPVKKEGLEDV
jgi:hypothetical protein